MKALTKIDTIIWPLDPFQESDAPALGVGKVLQGLTKKWNARIIPVYVLNPVQFNLSHELWTDWESEYQPVAEKNMNALVKKAKLRNVQKPEVIVDLSPFKRSIVTTLLRYAIMEEASLIAVATHGRSGLRRLFMGSFAETLVLKAKTPLLTVNPSYEQSGTFDRILFPTDLDRKAKPSFTKAVEFAGKIGAEIELYHRFPTLLAPTENAVRAYYAEYELEELVEERRRAGKWAVEAWGKGVRASVVIDEEYRPLDDAILAQCRARKGQIIAMSPERGKLETLLLGSLTRQIVRAATCPVWVLHR